MHFPVLPNAPPFSRAIVIDQSYQGVCRRPGMKPACLVRRAAPPDGHRLPRRVNGYNLTIWRANAGTDHPVRWASARSFPEARAGYYYFRTGNEALRHALWRGRLENLIADHLSAPSEVPAPFPPPYEDEREPRSKRETRTKKLPCTTRSSRPNRRGLMPLGSMWQKPLPSFLPARMART